MSFAIRIAAGPRSTISQRDERDEQRREAEDEGRAEAAVEGLARAGKDGREGRGDQAADVRWVGCRAGSVAPGCASDGRRARGVVGVGSHAARSAIARGVSLRATTRASRTSPAGPARRRTW